MRKASESLAEEVASQKFDGTAICRATNCSEEDRRHWLPLPYT